MSCTPQTAKIIVDSSLVCIESEYQLTTTASVYEEVLTTIELPSGTVYNSHDANTGVIDASNPELIVWRVPQILKNQTATLNLEVLVSEETSFSASDRMVKAVTTPVTGEINIINNDKDKLIPGITCSDIKECSVGLLFQQDQLISGGAIWKEDLVYEVSNVVFVLDGQLYFNEADEVTLTAADAVNPRIDVIVANVNGDIEVVTGIPAADPVKPEIDTSTQIEITFATISALATEPDGLSTFQIYDDNMGDPTEWDAAENTGSARIDLANGNSWTGSVSIQYDASQIGDEVELITPTLVDTFTMSSISFRMKPIAGNPWVGSTLDFQFFSGVTPASDVITVSDSPGVWDSTNPTDWILFIFDQSDWNFTAPQVDTLKITTRNGTLSVNIDDIKYVVGMPIPPPAVNTLYSGDGWINENRTVNVNNASLLFEGGQNGGSGVLWNEFESFGILADSGNASSAFGLWDQNAGINLRYNDITGDSHSFVITDTAIEISRESSGGGTGDSAIWLFDTNGGKIALDATTYRYGDGSGGNLPAVDNVTTYALVIDTANGHVGRTLKSTFTDTHLFTGNQVLGAGVNHNLDSNNFTFFDGALFQVTGVGGTLWSFTGTGTGTMSCTAATQLYTATSAANVSTFQITPTNPFLRNTDGADTAEIDWRGGAGVRLGSTSGIYKLGDGLGGDLPPLDATPTHILTLNTGTGAIEYATKVNSSNTIYNANGSLTGNRTINCDSNSILFSTVDSSAASGFNISGTGAFALASIQNTANVGALDIRGTSAATNSVKEVLQIWGGTTGTGAIGLGTGIVFVTDNDTLPASAGWLEIVNTDALLASHTTKFQVRLLNSSAENTVMEIAGNGDVKFNDYSGTKSVTETDIAVFDASGTFGKIPINTVVSQGAGNLSITLTDALEITILKTVAGDTITLPSSARIGQKFTVKDASGGATGTPITIDTAGAETIDGSASVQIIANYDSLTFIYDGTNFHSI